MRQIPFHFSRLYWITINPFVSQIKVRTRPTLNVHPCTAREMYSAVQINVVEGCVSAVLFHATFDHVYLDSRVLHVNLTNAEWLPKV